jgi:hypothetical protein
MRTHNLLWGLAATGALALQSGQAAAQARSGGHPHDSAFHAMQMRGKVVMGVDQYTSTHQFEDLADGGRIELQRDRDDAQGTAAIRAHLKSISAAFQKGDFSAPALVHMKEVPGASEMAARKTSIRYTFKELPRCGEVKISTKDPAAVAAVHKFLAFQRTEHH